MKERPPNTSITFAINIDEAFTQIDFVDNLNCKTGNLIVKLFHDFTIVVVVVVVVIITPLRPLCFAIVVVIIDSCRFCGGGGGGGVVDIDRHRDEVGGGRRRKAIQKRRQDPVDRIRKSATTAVLLI